MATKDTESHRVLEGSTRNTSGHCGLYALEINNLPEAALIKPSLIADFFSPIDIHGVEWVRMPAGGLWKINFGSERGLEAALEERQWQYLADQSIRLTKLDEHHAVKEMGLWASIHRDLQMDILSNFEVFHRPSLRRVCSEWNVLLECFWEQEITRCLRLDLKSNKHVKSYPNLSHTLVNTYHMWGRTRKQK